MARWTTLGVVIGTALVSLSPNLTAADPTSSATDNEIESASKRTGYSDAGRLTDALVLGYKVTLFINTFPEYARAGSSTSLSPWALTLLHSIEKRSKSLGIEPFVLDAKPRNLNLRIEFNLHYMYMLDNDYEQDLYRIGKYAAALIIYGNQHILFKDRDTAKLYFASRGILIALLQKHNLETLVEEIPDISGPGGFNLFIQRQIETGFLPELQSEVAKQQLRVQHITK
jgi:hypothetical protein